MEEADGINSSEVQERGTAVGDVVEEGGTDVDTTASTVYESIHSMATSTTVISNQAFVSSFRAKVFMTFIHSFI